MSIGPIIPNSTSGITNSPSDKSVQATEPALSTGDSTDRDGDGRQVLDVFERSESDDSEDPPNDPPGNGDGQDSIDADGGLNFLA